MVLLSTPNQRGWSMSFTTLSTAGRNWCPRPDLNRHALKATDFKSVVSAYSTTRACAAPYASGCGREHSLYIPRALCGLSQQIDLYPASGQRGGPKVRLLVSRGAGSSIAWDLHPNLV